MTYVMTNVTARHRDLILSCNHIRWMLVSASDNTTSDVTRVTHKVNIIKQRRIGVSDAPQCHGEIEKSGQLTPQELCWITRLFVLHTKMLLTAWLPLGRSSWWNFLPWIVYHGGLNDVEAAERHWYWSFTQLLRLFERGDKYSKHSQLRLV